MTFRRQNGVLRVVAYVERDIVGCIVTVYIRIKTNHRHREQRAGWFAMLHWKAQKTQRSNCGRLERLIVKLEPNFCASDRQWINMSTHLLS